MGPSGANPGKVLAVDHLIGLVSFPYMLSEPPKDRMRRRLEVSKQGHLRHALRRANWIGDEMAKTSPSQPVEPRRSFPPKTIVSARPRPDLHAAGKVAGGLARMVQVEEESPALLPVFDLLEALLPVALVGTQLPTKVLAEVAAEVNGSVQIQNQIARAGGQDALA